MRWPYEGELNPQPSREEGYAQIVFVPFKCENGLRSIADGRRAYTELTTEGKKRSLRSKHAKLAYSDHRRIGCKGVDWRSVWRNHPDLFHVRFWIVALLIPKKLWMLRKIEAA
jgi:hypothetical protein